MTARTCPHCGCDLTPERKGKPRSVPQHRRYFALIRAAKHHWPESHEFRPSSEEHLRKWLQCKAGYHTSTTIDTAGMSPEQAVAAIAAALRTAPEHAFVRAKGSKLYVIASRSINFDALPHLTACALFDAVAEIVESETGCKISQILPPALEPGRSRAARAREDLLEASL